MGSVARVGVVEVGGEFALQLAAGAAEAGFDGAGGNAEDGGDLLDAHFLDMVEDDDGAIVFRQGVDCFVEYSLRFGARE